MKRIYSIDFTRGLVMIIMALDHVRDLMHVDALTQRPTNLETTTPILFFTRLITHLCAPTFVFLSGVSVFLSLQRANNVSELRNFLLKRGLYLVILEITVVNFGLFFDIGFHTVIFEVIAAIGIGFIILALLIKASVKTIGIIGLLIIFCHDLFPIIPFPENSVIKTILTPFFTTTVFPIPNHGAIVIGYPPIPWLGIMLAGFATGKWFQLAQSERKSLFLKTGIVALLLFVVLRFINVYGDPVPWSVQKNSMFTFLSFMNISKYPPSLLFTLATLGVTFLILSFAEGINNKATDIVSRYGKVPLFYFVIHFYLIHLMTILMLLLQGISFSQMEFATNTFGRPKSLQTGVSLWVIYILWISVVIILYKPCVWFGKYKAEHTDWWLKYI